MAVFGSHGCGYQATLHANGRVRFTGHCTHCDQPSRGYMPEPEWADPAREALADLSADPENPELIARYAPHWIR